MTDDFSKRLDDLTATAHRNGRLEMTSFALEYLQKLREENKISFDVYVLIAEKLLKEGGRK